MSVFQDQGLIRKPVTAFCREKLRECPLFENVGDDVLDRPLYRAQEAGRNRVEMTN